jgi:predicted dipeptidase
VGGRVYEISLKGRGEVLIGLHAYADVVPANPDNWVLPDGTKLDPFKMTRIGGRLYGRGTQDDKNGMVAVMYALRVIKEEHISLWNDIKLIVDTTEETTSTAIDYYFKRNPTPDYNFALDGDYPVVIAEKGFSVIKTVFPKRQGSDGDIAFVSLTGGLATNQIPSVSQSKILSATPNQTAQQLSDLAEGFLAQHGGNFSITASPLGDAVMLTVTGDSAHSSAPESGVNPIPRMLMFIHHVQSTVSVKANQINDVAQYASENWGLDYLGQKFGIAFEHDFMGPLTAAFIKVAEDDSSIEISVNLRIPVGSEIAQLESEVRSTIANWQTKTAIEMEFSWRAKEAMYRDPKGRWVNTLLDIASESLSMPREFGSSAGGTSVHFLPNGVQFGLSMPDEKYTGHNANEFKTVEQFLVDLQIVTEMIIRIGQMNHLE